MFISDEILNGFSSISLEETDTVRLLNRMDTKYVFNAAQLPDILEDLKSDYRVLEINGVRSQRYQTLYFDTAEKQFYRNHHNGKLNRIKVRSRKYLDTGQCYFEVKLKTNKDRTIKKRIKQDGLQECISDSQAILLTTLTPYSPDMLSPVIWVNFSRITLVNHAMTERITMDTRLHFRQEGKEAGYPQVIIAEIKQNRTAGSLFHKVLHNNHINKLSISKYCLGVITLDPKIKQNRFKEKFIQINKINHDTY